MRRLFPEKYLYLGALAKCILSFTEVNLVETLASTMKTLGINFKLFGVVLNFRVSAYKSAHIPDFVQYGSTSNFGKWKTAPYGISNEYKPKRKRK